MSNVFFTSDTHFGHKNIIQYCERPFKDVHDQTETLIALWNTKVGPQDVVYHLGDFAFMPADKAEVIVRRLNGSINLILGNHDKVVKQNKPLREAFASVRDMAEVTLREEQSGEKMTFVLCHYAMRVWNRSHRGAMHLYGHSHGTLPDDPNSLSMDVGIDTHPNLQPYSMDEVLLHMYRKKYKPVDHHGTTGRD